MRLQRLSAEDSEAHEEAVAVIQRSFLPGEAVCVAAGVAASPQAVRELSQLTRAALRDGDSVAAYLGDAMVGVAVNSMLVSEIRLKVLNVSPAPPLPAPPRGHYTVEKTFD